MSSSSYLPKSILKINDSSPMHQDDLLAVEEPLEIRLLFGDAEERTQKSIAVTMRTPGHDFELVTGFLFTEGIIKNATDIVSIKHCNGLQQNVVKVELREDIKVAMQHLNRNFYTTSSCGVCGKSSIEAVKTVCQLPVTLTDGPKVSCDIISSLPAILQNRQDVFSFTGGLHACGLFSSMGKLLLCKEDVGRHNALDKLIGAALQHQLFPLDSYILLLSGRASFELVQKAWMAGIQMIAAVGAPSSLAVQMAEEAGITLLGFVRNKRFNIYTGDQRIIVYSNENSYQG